MGHVRPDRAQRAPRALRRRRPPPAAPPSPAPGATTLLHREAAEILAAARIAAASADEERVAGRRRLMRALIVLFVLAAVAAVIGFATYRERHRFVARVAGELKVQRDADGYAVRVDVETSGPARVELPEGAVGGPIVLRGGLGTLAFRLPERVLPVGDNRLTLQVVPDDAPGDARPLHLQVRVYYRFVSMPVEPPRPGGTVELRMELMPGWQLRIPDAKIVPEPGGALTVAVDAAPLLALADRFAGASGEFPLRLELSGPDGASATFVEALRFPLPETRLTVLAPLRAEVVVAPVVTVEGLATPGAQITIAAVAGRADASGRFRLDVPLSVEGRHTLDVQAQTEGRAPGRATLLVDRVDPPTLARRKADARRLADAIRSPAPPYASLLDGPPVSGGGPIRITGRVLALRRGEADGVDELQLATCPAGCPYWLTTSQPVFARLGDDAVAVGRLIGRHDFVTRDGRPAVAPHLDALAVHARP